MQADQPPLLAPHLLVKLHSPQDRGDGLEVRLPLDGMATNPYQLVKAWNAFPRPLRLALGRAGLDARGFVATALTICRQVTAGVSFESLRALRVGPGLTIGIDGEASVTGPAPRVVIVRHPEWTGAEAVVEGRFHSV